MNRLIKLTCTTTLLLLVLTASVIAAPYYAKVIGVTDGDTITVLTAEKKQVKIRLDGIDCPESYQDYGTKAKQAASNLCFGKQVTVIPVEKDRYGRTVAKIVLPNGKSLNQLMVAKGWAWWYKQYAPNDQTLAYLQATAQKNKLGLWAGKNPVAPWDFRHHPSSTTSQTSVNKPNPGKSTSIVHITRTGSKYHTANCRYLARSDIPVSLGDAISRGLTPCSVCGGGGGSVSKVRHASTPSSSGNDIVHVTNTGSKYHRAGCRYLSRSDNPIPRKQAIEQGYSPCSICAP